MKNKEKTENTEKTEKDRPAGLFFTNIIFHNHEKKIQKQKLLVSLQNNGKIKEQIQNKQTIVYNILVYCN